MTTQKSFSKKFLSIALGVTMILLSGSLFVFSLSTLTEANASPKVTTPPAPWDDGLRGGVGLGVKDNTGYFVIWGSDGNQFYKVNLSKARDWYLD